MTGIQSRAGRPELLSLRSSQDQQRCAARTPGPTLLHPPWQGIVFLSTGVLLRESLECKLGGTVNASEKLLARYVLLGQCLLLPSRVRRDP
jgi:hypothetical protein